MSTALIRAFKSPSVHHSDNTEQNMATEHARGQNGSRQASSSGLASAAQASRTAALPGTRGSRSTVTEEEVEVFLSSVRSADVDKKVNLIQLWGLKLESVDELPERTIDAMTTIVAPFLRASSHLLLMSTLSSFLPTFLPLIPSTGSQPHLRLALAQLLPSLVEKLGDPKEKVHSAATENILWLGRKVYENHAPASKSKEKEEEITMWETAVKDALAGRSARAKVESLKLLLRMRADPSIKVPLKPWLPVLVDLLEDSDGSVRDSARETVVALLVPPSTPAAARTQLKMLMAAKNVRKSIADAILNRVLGGQQVEPTAVVGAKDDGPEPSRSGPTPPTDDVEIVYIASPMDLQNEFRTMIPFFAGKETEHNWGPRERSITRIRGMLRGRVFSNHPDAFLAGLKGELIEGIGKTLMSLRTTVAQQSCALVQELAEYLGPSFDSSAEVLLPVLGKMAGLTKRIIADKSQAAVTAIYKHCTVSPRILVSHAGAAIQDKSVHARQYGLGHLRTFLDHRAIKQVSAVESHPGMVKDIEQLIRKGLGDTNPQVREQARLTFWCFNSVWPREGSALIESLDGVARKQLEKANPHLAAKPVEAKAAPKKPRASSVMSAMLAAKRAEAAEKAAQRSRTGSPQDELLPTSPKALERSQLDQGADNSSAVEPANADTPEHALNGSGPSRLPEASSAEELNKNQVASTLRNEATPAVEHDGTVSHERPAAAEQSARASVTSPPVTSPQSHGHQNSAESRLPASDVAGPTRIPAPTSIPKPGGAAAGTSQASSRSRSSSLARTMSRSPPSKSEHGLYSPRHGGSTLASQQQQFMLPQTPARSVPQIPRAQNASSATPRQPSYSAKRSAMYDNGSFTSPDSVAHRTPMDPAEEARRAQAAQGISAAEQLLDYDDDEQQVNMPPMTPLRHNVPANFTTPLATHKHFKAWEDSPKVVTPKLMKQLQSRPHERSWWNERRSLLKHAAPIEGSVAIADIQADIDTLARGSPSVTNFQRLATFSSTNALGDPPSEQSKAMWSEQQSFDRLRDGLLNYLHPRQPVQLLEHALVLLWELVQNQWALLESREDDLLDALFRLRTTSNMIVLESTNSMLSLLTDVCDPPFLLLLLHAALSRYLSGLDVNPTTSSDITGDRAKAAGYNYGLNAMGMSILRLPREAVAAEAGRLEPHVMKALALTAQDCVPARQAANRVILAVQCMLEDDSRTLALFPSLDKKQRAFVTYQMEQNGVLRKPATTSSPAQSNHSRQAIHHELVDGMARGSRVIR